MFPVPMPARLVPHAGEILDGDTVGLEIAIDFPAEQLSLLDQLVREHQNPFRVEVDWVIQRLDGTDRTVTHSAGRVAKGHPQLRHDRRFKLAGTESAATWSVTAFVRTNYFYPASIATQIEVKTEAARLAELRAEAAGDLGSEAVTVGPDGKPGVAHDFDIGTVDDAVSPDQDDHGRRFSGAIPPGYKPPTDAQRSAGRAKERETQAQLLRYLQQTTPDSTEAIAAVQASIARIDEAAATLANDTAAGWRTFQVRGTFMSRDERFASGPLDLYGTVQYQTRVEIDPSAVADQTAPEALSGVAVQVRDLSRRFENAAPRYEGFAPTFEAAFESAFVDLCKAYPAGTVSILAEELSPSGGIPTGKTVGFELGTSSRVERVKEAVWDPAVNIVVNMAAVAMMAFAPYTAPILFPALTAYNTLRTVDELRELSTRGLLTDHKLKLSMASIAFDLLPFAKYAKVVATRDWLRYAVELADHGGQVAIMTHEVRDLAVQLQEQDVAALAQMYRELSELEQTSHPSDPRIRQQRKAIEERAQEVGQRGYDAFTQVAGTRGLFMIAAHQFQKLGAAAGEAVDLEPGRRRAVVPDADEADTRSKTAAGADESPAPVFLVHNEPDLAAALRLVPQEPGVLLIGGMHGTADDFVVKTPSGEVTLTPRQLARYVRRHRRNIQRIRLLSCFSGAHPKAAAQHLANKAGVPVIAAADAVHVHTNGKVTTGEDPEFDTNSWIEFTPKPSEPRSKLAPDAPPPTAREHLAARRAASSEESKKDAETARGSVRGHDTDDADAVHSIERTKIRTEEETTRDPEAPTAHKLGGQVSAKEAAAELGQIAIAVLPRGSGSRIDYRVSARDGQRMAQLFKLVPGYSTQTYKSGLLVRRGDSEWFFEYGNLGSTVGSADGPVARGPDGMPAPNVATIELWGFRGMRTKNGRKEREWTEDDRKEFDEAKARNTLLWAGHVGISYDGGKTIHGFTPDRTQVDNGTVSLNEFMRNLLTHMSYPGVVGDDTAVFVDAARLAEAGWNTEIVKIVELANLDQRAASEAQVQAMSNVKPGEHGLYYSFPLAAEEDGEFYRSWDGHLASQTRNCATFPEKVGVKVPERSGQLHDYMPALTAWAHEDRPIDIRPSSETD